MNFALFFSGIATATFAASGLFFLRFWKAAGDRFFLLFSMSCFLLAIERVLVLAHFEDLQNSIRTPVVESYAWVYLMRLSAFAILSLAILDKNRARASGP